MVIIFLSFSASIHLQISLFKKLWHKRCFAEKENTALYCICEICETAKIILQIKPYFKEEASGIYLPISICNVSVQWLRSVHRWWQCWLTLMFQHVNKALAVSGDFTVVELVEDCRCENEVSGAGVASERLRASDSFTSKWWNVNVRTKSRHWKSMKTGVAVFSCYE